MTHCIDIQYDRIQFFTDCIRSYWRSGESHQIQRKETDGEEGCWAVITKSEVSPEASVLVKLQTEGKGAPIRDVLRRIVLERIVRGELAPGARIKESRLAGELGTSRTPLREALIHLEQEGYIRSELAHGFSVEPFSGREVRETYPILWTLESLALRSSGSVIYSMLGELSEINTMLAHSMAPAERLTLDTDWHEKLLSHCPNRRLNDMISGLRTVMRRYEHLFMSDTALVAESVQQHQQIIERLQGKEVERAEQILRENWRVGMDLLLVRLGEP